MITIAEFFQKFEYLKQKEKWQETIELGNEALKAGPIGIDSVKIELILASCYFYLGNINETLNLAKQILETINNLFEDQHDLKARALYLSSAAYRMLAQKAESEEGKKIYTVNSDNNINKALELTKNVKLENFIIAKIYFNAGALEQDVKNNLAQSMEYYSKAMDIFGSEKEWVDDYNRAAIRYIRCKLENGNLRTALIEAKKLSNNIDINSKTGVHLLYLIGKIYLKKEDYVRSYQCTKQAIDIANNKNMNADLAKIKELEKEILEKAPEVINYQYLNNAVRALEI
ncbi:MAG: tetratricopeptide repeat protein [Alphaproteobacteria bacterium]